MPNNLKLLLGFAALTFCLTANRSLQANEQEKFFESKIRPLLAKHCFECHGEKKQESSIRLDRKSLVFGKTPQTDLVKPGDVEQSRLWQVIKYDELDIQMPPAGAMPEEDRELLKHWIQQGAYWPDDPEPSTPLKTGIPRNEDGSINYVEAVQQHWAYRPVEDVPTPEPKDPSVCRNEVDRFVAARLEDAGLTFSPLASRETIIRRLKMDLHGIPPTYEEVQAFVQDTDPAAIEHLVDRLLDSPLYGQRWGRHWLDVARYADTKGYVFTDNRFYPFSYTYRDYVIQAFNEDKPYNEFIREQLAADQLGFPEKDPRMAALGFLTVGPRFLNREPDIIDDRIDVVTRGLMGMTVACARCHDHKYDPIPTTDYYSLYGVFQSSYEPPEGPLVGEVDLENPDVQAFFEERRKREQAVEDYISKTHAELLQRAMDQMDDLIPAAAKSMKLIPDDTDLQLKHGNPREKLVEHWKKFIERRLNENDPVMLAWKNLMEAGDEVLSQPGNEPVRLLLENESVPTPIRAELESNPPRSRLEVARMYARVFSAVRGEWLELQKQEQPPEALADDGREKIRQVLFGTRSASDVPVADRSPLFERDQFDRINALRRKVKEWDTESPHAPPRAMALLDKDKPVKPVVFVRGDPNRRGDPVERQAPRILDPHEAKPFTQGSGRLELAEKIVSPDNPLTARVLVNRVWGWHFGTPIVPTTSDFGSRSEAPSHPELLDHLAWHFMHEDNWSLKALHRRILLSTTYLQASDDRPEARAVDPENRLLWRQNRQRLDFESMRDSMLQVSGLLDPALGGRSFNVEAADSPPRRTVYAQIDRNNLPGLLRTFDYPSPDSSSPGRPLTSVPQQALFAMNSGFVARIATKLAEDVRSAHSDLPQQVQTLVQRVYARNPEPHEAELMLSYLESNPLEHLAQALLMTNEFLFVD